MDLLPEHFRRFAAPFSLAGTIVETDEGTYARCTSNNLTRQQHNAHLALVQKSLPGARSPSSREMFAVLKDVEGTPDSNLFLYGEHLGAAYTAKRVSSNALDLVVVSGVEVASTAFGFCPLDLYGRSTKNIHTLQDLRAGFNIPRDSLPEAFFSQQLGEGAAQFKGLRLENWETQPLIRGCCTDRGELHATGDYGSLASPRFVAPSLSLIASLGQDFYNAIPLITARE